MKKGLGILLVVVLMLSFSSAAFASNDFHGEKALTQGVQSCEAPEGFAEDTSPAGPVEHVNTIEPVMVNSLSGNTIPKSVPRENLTALLSEPLPFDFTFSFYANLTSRMFDNTGDSVTIEITDSCWVDNDGYELDDQYFAIYLYTGDHDLIGYTLSMPVWCDGNYSSHSVTFDDVPEGDIYFVLSKPYTTYDYELKGSGRISSN
ncbi:hypothetical protein IJ21_48140 [Paenibacillus sp. 32O-W]|uniref:hypothetical protein n=1 Tax=Paenibacillus sp. 32O-W TaxID=1695218 RepID=UPI000722592D|nr:hypothetical protein [Paenibacillus sp. 32O-W]ALS30175.1 hypothetical protein IJ21_48140 [Paenibacillus sp. 32O-W]